MLPLGRSIQKIKDYLSYDPKLRTYHDSLIRRINEAYIGLAESKPYSFFTRTDDSLQVYATVEGSATQTIEVAAANQRAVVCNSSSWMQAGWSGQGTFISPLGQEVEIIGVDLANRTLFLEETLDALVTAGSTDWSIVFRRYLLPSDTISVLGYMDRLADDGWGRLTSLSNRAEERLFLDRDDDGRPLVAIQADAIARRPPFVAPTLAAATTGSLPLRKYAYRYTIKSGGVESPPSPEAEITLTGSQDQVNITGLEDVRWDQQVSAKESGIDRIIYRRDLTREGPWMAVATLASGTTSGYNDQTELPTYASNWDEVIYDNPDGTRQTTRFWYTASEDRVITLRTWFRPAPLQALSHAPRGPMAVSTYLENTVLSELMSGTQASLAAGRAAAALDTLKGYLARTDERHVRRSFKADMGDRPSRWDYNLGIPTKV